MTLYLELFGNEETVSKSTFVQVVTSEQIATLANKGFSTTSGTLPETSGVILSYVVSDDTITFTVEKKPFLVPVSAIQSHVRNLLTQG